uniref:Uncharacterized protein n=1 Tax=Prolemur simus TaxID=1328070 RepID=A0A8C8ZWN6_PROSS
MVPRRSLPDGQEKSLQERKVYVNCNVTTSLEPEVIQTMTEAMLEAWGSPSSPYLAV